MIENIARCPSRRESRTSSGIGRINAVVIVDRRRRRRGMGTGRGGEAVPRVVNVPTYGLPVPFGDIILQYIYFSYIVLQVHR